MPGRIHPYRLSALSIGLVACTAAWLVVKADGPAPPDPTNLDKPASQDSTSTRESERPALPQRNPEAKSADSTLPASAEAIVNEILQIRREQGGLLDGTLLEELSDSDAQVPGRSPGGREEEFVRALRGVAAAAAANPNSSRQNHAIHSNTLANATFPPGEDPRNDMSSDAQLIDLVRLTARRLDSQAADYEEADDYRHANRCRAIARQLRRLARELKASIPR